ncbi:MAG: hypothetical protein AAGE01_14725 [Pseudomonadota bacterium]
MSQAVAGRRLGILIHARSGRHAIRGYFIGTLAKVWAADGIVVRPVSPERRLPHLDLLFNHVDVSCLDDVYRKIIGMAPRVVNGGILDIRKSVVSNHLIERGSAWTGPVIVKTDLNFGGYPERALFGDGPDNLSPNGFVKPLDYQVFDSWQEVPREFFDDPLLVVEKFLPERTPDGRYRLRSYNFLGDAEDCFLITSTQPIVNSHSIESIEPVEVHEAVRATRLARGFDYGKFDYVVHEGEPVIFDTNKTPGFFDDDSPEFRAMLLRRARALYPFFER